MQRDWFMYRLKSTYKNRLEYPFIKVIKVIIWLIQFDLGRVDCTIVLHQASLTRCRLFDFRHKISNLDPCQSAYLGAYSGQVFKWVKNHNPVRLRTWQCEMSMQIMLCL